MTWNVCAVFVNSTNDVTGSAISFVSELGSTPFSGSAESSMYIVTPAALACLATFSKTIVRLIWLP